MDNTQYCEIFRIIDNISSSENFAELKAIMNQLSKKKKTH